MSNELVVKFKDSVGNDLELTPEIVMNTLVSGSGKVTEQELVMFMRLCEYRHLNPFLKQAYLIKYSDKSAATMVVGKDVFTERALKHRDCDGWENGIILMIGDKIEYRAGTFSLENENLVGGWSKVYRKSFKVPMFKAVSMKEYEGKKFNYDTKTYETNAQWKSKPNTMIAKVALVQALREAFPEEFGGLYDSTELDADVEERDVTPKAASPMPESETYQVDETVALSTPKDRAAFYVKMERMGYNPNTFMAEIKSDFQSCIDSGFIEPTKAQVTAKMPMTVLRTIEAHLEAKAKAPKQEVVSEAPKAEPVQQDIF